MTTTISTAQYVDLNASLVSQSDLEANLLSVNGEGSSLLGLPLVFQNVNVTLKSGRKLLDSISGVIKPGKLVGILGASGAGKSTFLNALCGRIAADTDSIITVANRPVSDDLVRNSIAYVQQDDLFLGTLTAREHLQYAARLRVPQTISYETKMNKVEHVISQMGLTKSADTRIGTQFRRGLSGGEKKRLSVATDLLNDPIIMCCDEPTSGLDSYMAYGVVQQLKLLANQGKTVLSTIHQPSPEVFELFDEVIFLAEGKVAYNGPTSSLVQYFISQGLECPIYSNPADYVIKMLSTTSTEGDPESAETKKDRVLKLVAAWRSKESTLAQAIDQEEVRSLNALNNVKFTAPIGANWINQLVIMTSRSFKALMRDTMLTYVRFAQSLVLALIAGAIYWQIGSNDMNQPQTILSISGALFFIVTNQGFSGIFGVLQAFPLELPVFLREYSSGCYRVDTYYLSKSIAEIPSQVVFPAIFGGIVFPMLGLYTTFDNFLVFILSIILCAQAAMSLGYMVSTAAKTVQVALAIGPIAILPIMLFGGFYINVDQIPAFLRWIQYLSFFKYSFELLGINEFRNNEQAMKLYSFNANNYYYDIYMLIGIAVVFRVLAFIFLYIRARASVKVQRLV